MTLTAIQVEYDIRTKYQLYRKPAAATNTRSTAHCRVQAWSLNSMVVMMSELDFEYLEFPKYIARTHRRRSAKSCKYCITVRRLNCMFGTQKGTCARCVANASMSTAM